MRNNFLYFLLLAILLLPKIGSAGEGFILLSTTIGPIDAGIVSVLEDRFEQETGIRVRHIGAGTTAALDIAKKGSVDLVMAHARSVEEKFVAEGFGTDRIALMYNDFVILGPAGDPAGIKGMPSAAAAFKAIAAKGAPFISRGDKSGTHLAEMQIWEKAGLTPSGAWYTVYEKGAEGNAPTLRFTEQKQAYTFMDRATYLSLKSGLTLSVLVEKDEALLNYISLIPVNPKKFPAVNHKDTMTFVNWLTSPAKGQAIISDFGKDKYGSAMFFPNSKEWTALHKETQK
ncbi:MAG: substrate-binding domain-containing protein [Pseudomonadota bacterium]